MLRLLTIFLVTILVVGCKNHSQEQNNEPPVNVETDAQGDKQTLSEPQCDYSFPINNGIGFFNDETNKDKVECLTKALGSQITNISNQMKNSRLDKLVYKRSGTNNALTAPSTQSADHLITSSSNQNLLIENNKSQYRILEKMNGKIDPAYLYAAPYKGKSWVHDRALQLTENFIFSYYYEYLDPSTRANCKANITDIRTGDVILERLKACGHFKLLYSDDNLGVFLNAIGTNNSPEADIYIVDLTTYSVQYKEFYSPELYCSFVNEWEYGFSLEECGNQNRSANLLGIVDQSLIITDGSGNYYSFPINSDLSVLVAAQTKTAHPLLPDQVKKPDFSTEFKMTALASPENYGMYTIAMRDKAGIKSACITMENSNNKCDFEFGGSHILYLSTFLEDTAWEAEQCVTYSYLRFDDESVGPTTYCYSVPPRLM